jgi:hypothetical protein
MFGGPERLPAFGARPFPTVITTSVVQDLTEKIAGIDWMMHWLSIAKHISWQSHELTTNMNGYDQNKANKPTNTIVINI